MSRGRFDDSIHDGTTLQRYLKVNGPTKTLGAALTLANDDGVFHQYDAGGSSRNVTLPARALANDGAVRIITNLSTAGENLVIKNSGGTTLLTLGSGSTALVMASGTLEAPETRAWVAIQIGGEDLAIVDDLSVAGDLAVTGNTALTGSVLASAGGKFAATTSIGISFYGTTTVSQRASSAQNTTLVVSNSIGTAAEAVLEEICNTLTALGLWKGAA
jgi:hypothetical protein